MLNKLPVMIVAIGLATASPAFAVKFHEPAIDPATSAKLDPLLAAHDWHGLAMAASPIHDPLEYEQGLNWLKVHVDDGGPVFLSRLYAHNLWTVADAMTKDGRDAPGMRELAAMMVLYSISLVMVDGTACADASARGGRMEQILFGNGPILKYLHGLPSEDRASIAKLAIQLESATAPVRNARDAFICSGGLDSFRAGLRKGTVQDVPSPPPGYVGHVETVTPPPGYKPAFLAQTVYEPKRMEARKHLPELLATLTK